MKTWARLVLPILGTVAVVTAASLRGFWLDTIGRSLVCPEKLAPSDMILVENFTPNYLLFERAATLERTGLAPRALIPVQASNDPQIANPVSKGIAELMATHARLNVWGLTPVREVEPISLTTAVAVRDHLAQQQHIRSLIIVTAGFRSRRSALVYHTLLDPLGTQVYCAPVFGETTPERWPATWHGIQQVAEELLKLQYYRFYVLPFLSRDYQRYDRVSSE